ncbi:hypothetical protein LINPERPRIM_LOCUS15982 [Linum perenne]
MLPICSFRMVTKGNPDSHNLLCQNKNKNLFSGSKYGYESTILWVWSNGCYLDILDGEQSWMTFFGCGEYERVGACKFFWCADPEHDEHVKHIVVGLLWKIRDME